MKLYRVEIECSEVTPSKRRILVNARSSIDALTHALSFFRGHCPAQLSVRVSPSSDERAEPVEVTAS